MIEKLQGKIKPSVLAEIPSVIARFRIDTPNRMAHFLGQAAHESGGFNAITEGLNYSAEGLLKTFPKYFNATTAAQYARKQQEIANRVYASRMGNGNEASGDGFRFRGRGYIQLTGKNNYASFDAFVDDDILGNPDLVATKYPLLSAAWFWHTNKLNLIADKGVSTDIITQITKRVNGGTHGLQDRIDKTNHYYNIIK